MFFVEFHGHRKLCGGGFKQPGGDVAMLLPAARQQHTAQASAPPHGNKQRAAQLQRWTDHWQGVVLKFHAAPGQQGFVRQRRFRRQHLPFPRNIFAFAIPYHSAKSCGRACSWICGATGIGGFQPHTDAVGAAVAGERRQRLAQQFGARQTLAGCARDFHHGGIF